MLKRIALAVMASSLLFACGGEESSDDDECVLDEAAVCAGKQCGNVSTQDSCGEMKTVSCGTCADGTTCQANMCISDTQPTCELSDEEKAAKCADKCGTISVMDHCETIIDLDCGTDICGDGQVCHATENRCMDESECAMSDEDALAYCYGNICGAAQIQDHCGNIDYIDCADASAPIDPLKDFEIAKDETGNYVGDIWGWDEAGQYYALLFEGPMPEDPEASMSDYFTALIFSKDITPGTYDLSPIHIEGNSWACGGEVCLLIAHNAMNGYYYSAVTGSVTISDGLVSANIENARLGDIDSSDCYSTGIDFTIIREGDDCSEIDPLKDFEIAKDENGNYVSDIWGWDEAGQYYAFLAEGPMVDGEDMSPYFAGVIIKSTLDYGTYDLTPATLTENFFECTGDACLLIASNADDYYYYTATAGTVTISENGDSGLMFSVTADGFSDMLNPFCLIPGASFNIVYESAPVDCSSLGNPMDAFTADEHGEYTGEIDDWDSRTGHKTVFMEGTADGVDASFYIIYKDSLTAGTYTVSATNDDAECESDVCAIIIGVASEQAVYYYDPSNPAASLTIGEGLTKFTLTSPGFVEYYTDCPLTLESIVINIPTTPAE
ncbi:MAG: hypothetical protein IKC51_05260 [Myxococcaceae bacterium]|nr:hypothetical protein [Myxococcaceae bacterium]